MATAQAYRATFDPGNLHDPVSYRCTMGSVGSLIDKQDFSPGNVTCDLGPPRGSRQPDTGLKKGLNQKELLSYLNITKKDWKGGKKLTGGLPFQREHSVDGWENSYPSMHSRDRLETNFTKTSLPERGRYDKPRAGPSSFKPIAVKNFLSMQSLCPSGGPKLSQSHNSLNSPAQRGPLKANHLHTISQDEREEEEGEDSLSDSGQHSVNSFPCYTPTSGPTRAPLSASMGHINHIGGSLDRATRGARDTLGGEKAPLSCKSMAMLSRLHSPGEPPPPYECSPSLEDMVRQLEEQLQQKGQEVLQLQRNLSDKEDPFAQVCEDRRRMWMEELAELKQMYVLKLQQVSQQALRTQRVLQLQLYKVQQEKKKLQEELSSLWTECEELKQRPKPPRGPDPKLEESKWEVEISLLKQQLRDSQAEMAQKLGEVFSLKTQLREARAQIREKDVTAYSDPLGAPQHPTGHGKELVPHERSCQDFSSCETDDSKCRGLQGGCTLPVEAQVGHLQAELRLERRQCEALLGAFEAERRTWKQEKERVLQYQREIQVGYMEMYHRSQELERELQDLKRLPPKAPTSLWMEQVDSSDS